MNALAIYTGSDGNATKELYDRLAVLGALGIVALNLFRAQKASARAKVYSRRFRGDAYAKKNWTLGLLVDALMENVSLGLVWGWREDTLQPVHKWVLYIELPTGQVSFHTEARLAGPDYAKDWDRSGDSASRIVRFVDSVLATAINQPGETGIGTVFSPDRVYRYTLWREWSPLFGFERQPRYVQFIGLNPSTADETTDDQTVRRCIVFAKRWGCAAMVMTNLFAYRATKPEDMKRQADPVGIDNDHWLFLVAAGAELSVAIWGNHGTHLNRAADVRAKFAQAGKPLHFIWKNLGGEPSHPLYRKGDLTPQLLSIPHGLPT